MASGHPAPAAPPETVRCAWGASEVGNRTTWCAKHAAFTAVNLRARSGVETWRRRMPNDDTRLHCLRTQAIQLPTRATRDPAFALNLIMPAKLSRILVVISTLVVMASGSPPLHAQQADVIRGRVVGPDSQPVENVVVTATSIAGNVSRTARTDRNGRYTITFPGGEGDYMVSFAAIGYAARRFEVKRLADEDILIADAKLQTVASVLDAVKVAGKRNPVPRNDVPPDVGGTERALSNAAVPADLMGDLAAMAASLPGVQMVPGENGDPNGYSVLGLGADQNNTTLNGMQFGGSNLPRDAAVMSSMVTSPYDVSRGGFSGAQMTLRTRPGSNFLTRGMSLNLDSPHLQWSDAATQALGQEYSNFSLGGSASGPIAFDKSFYNLSYQLGRRSNDLQTLLTTSKVGLQAAGVSSDSVSRLLDILGASQIPSTIGRLQDSRLGDQGLIFGNIDFAPPSSTTGQAFNVAFNGSWSRQSPVTGLATEVPAHSGDRLGWRSGVQGRHNGYFKGILSETSLGIGLSKTETAPFLAMPAGRVRVSSTFDNGASGVQNLSFGGSQMLSSTQRTRDVGFLNQLSWFSTDNKHRVKLTSELRHEAFAQEQSTNRLGTFTFNSLADLEAGRPSSFSRQLSPRVRDAKQLTGGLSLGDSYRRTPTLQFQYGVRLDANRFLTPPQENAAVASAFGRSNSELPNRVYLSPRMGFSWTYGTASQIAAFEGAARGPRAVVRGGVGVFQNLPSTNLVGAALENTGLAGAAQQLTCIGSATPVPDWDAYLSDPSLIPDQCADGTTGTVFADRKPNITLFSPDFRAPRSLRSNLQWSGPVLKNRLNGAVEVTWSRNLYQQSFVDLNFNPTQRFTLPDEKDRPVYVNTGSIVPATGAIATQDARVSPEYSRVQEMRSDLRSESRQLSFRVSPVRFSTTFNWSASYVYSNVREKTRGFSSTVGNPLATEWGRSAFDSRHQISYNLGYNFFDFVRVSWFGSFRSGRPYTPMVSGDINGDGYANDRAFIFDPAQTSDPAVASAMQSLLNGSSERIQQCLRRQLGQLAARNSCQAPWSSMATMSVSFNPLKVRMPNRATLSFQLSNPLGAADLLVNGSDRLRGWGQPVMPDQSLLYVRGFDAATQRYSYEVNQRFGSTNAALSAFRAPVTLTAMMRFDMGPTRERQMLKQQLDRGRRTRGDKAPPMMLRAMYGSGGIPNPLATVLRQQDSLKLTGSQADSIAIMNRWYTIRIDSIWSPFLQHLSSLPDNYDDEQTYEMFLKSRRATVDLLMKLGPPVKRLLTAEQIRKLPPFIASYLEPRYLASIRSGTGSFAGGNMFPGGDAMIAAGGMMMPSGGTTHTVIVRQ